MSARHPPGPWSGFIQWQSQKGHVNGSTSKGLPGAIGLMLGVRGKAGKFGCRHRGTCDVEDKRGEPEILKGSLRGTWKTRAQDLVGN